MGIRYSERTVEFMFTFFINEKIMPLRIAVACATQGRRSSTRKARGGGGTDLGTPWYLDAKKRLETTLR